MRPPRVVHLASLVLTAIAMSDKPQPRPRDAYRHFLPITTRWMDNDVYGHVNNVVYYSYFDTVVNEYLIRAGVLDVEHGQTIGLVVETQCNYFAPLVFPQSVDAGLRVVKLGTSSVRYEVGLFAQGDATPPRRALRARASIAARAGRCRCPMRCAPRSSRSRPDGACTRSRSGLQRPQLRLAAVHAVGRPHADLQRAGRAQFRACELLHARRVRRLQHRAGAGFWPALVLAPLAVGLLGAGCERMLLRRACRRAP